METALYEAANYDTVIATEFLEHVYEDLSVISKIKSGTYVIATVPNFPYVSHVRHFFDTEEVAARYKSFFDEFNVVEIRGDALTKKFFLLEGIKK